MRNKKYRTHHDEAERLTASNLELQRQLADAEKQRGEWKRSHDYVCKKLIACQNDRDFNAELCEKAEKQRDTLAAALRNISRQRASRYASTVGVVCDMADKALATLDQKEK